MRILVGLAILFASGACKGSPADGMRVEDCKTSAESKGVDLVLAFTSGGSTTSPGAAEDGKIRAVVIDEEWGPKVSTPKKTQPCETTVPVSAGTVDAKNGTASFHLEMTCPPVGPTITRMVEVTFTPASGASTTATAFLQSYDAATGKITLTK